MPRARKKFRSSMKNDDIYVPSASARRPSINVKPRNQRERRATTAFSPKVDTVVRKPRKSKDLSLSIDDNRNSTAGITPTRPEHKRLENKIKSQAHRLRYPLAFVEAYEADGWNKSCRDKLKPCKELEVEHCKIVKGKRALIEGLRELLALYAQEPQVPPMAMFEDVHCSRCGSTDIALDNDILLCDSPGCHRAYHQRCQTPVILTSKIPAGNDPWFCEVCLAIFECLKSINSVFGTTYENVDDLFPELCQVKPQLLMNDNNSAQSEDESTAVPAKVESDEEDDEDFVPESAQDLLFLSKDDVIDLNHRSMRSHGKITLLKPARKKVNLVGKSAAKINRKTGDVIFGEVVALAPPAVGRYSRWRIDYRDGTSELLTRSKAQAAIKCACVKNNGDRDEDEEVIVVRSKRKRNEVDYRQLNELMFAGKDEDSEDDETFEVKDESEEEPDEEEDNDANAVEELKEKERNKSIQCGQGDLSPTTVTASHDAIPQLTHETRSQRPRKRIDYHSMHEGLLS
ncbi:phd-finger family homeodomain protein [Plasmopara halstedii]|uniref:Phd-finger family homeodomain protein n=1 Tax=Plasmopara halstedii TaxID=4781 RepID=A0A0P1ABT1_PLAHL|nr:phd-finger family homeodomain protein [Plasmopara halstedii]CEG37918.1 phd-finger family homeodomain protein [Plasmopara halstedii]|eukprot:XP_024574287.1 phd-finger family homeodomain protein [Plasmopara halstedii]